MNSKLKLITGITAPGSVNLLRGQLQYFNQQGFETYLMAPHDARTLDYCARENSGLLGVDISREIDIPNDIKSLVKIYRHLQRVKPDVVNMGTPKMGLLGLIAAKFLGVKRRIYTCRGFRYEHETGFKRWLLINMERLAGYCAQDIICISQSVKELAIKDRVFKPAKCHVLHYGSSNGINTARFRPDVISSEDKGNLIKQLGLHGNFVFGFVGRLIDRKGISELYHAFSKLYIEEPASRLLIVGPAEFEQITDKSLVEKLKGHPGVLMPGRTDNVPLYLSVMDVFVLPAWWEGFGNVLVEAASMGIPVISTKGTGTRDAVKDGYNGILVEIKNADQLYNAMLEMRQNHDKRKQFGANGIKWAGNFDSNLIWGGMKDLFLR